MRSSAAVAALVMAGFLAAGTARAELIVFEDGRVVKAAGYQLYDDEVEIRLPGGGSYRVELSRVSRIVDDEVVVDAVVVEPDPGRPDASYDLSYAADRKPLFGTAYDALIEREAKRSNVDASFVSALIRAESNYEPRAVSRKGARGLMQLMPATAKRLSVGRPFDPAANVRGGVQYLRELVDRFGRGRTWCSRRTTRARARSRVTEAFRRTARPSDYVNRILRWWNPAEVRVSAAR